MSKKLNKLLVTTLTILVVSLVASFLRGIIENYYKDRNVYKSILLGMGVLVVIYYPMTLILNKYFTNLAQIYLKKSKKVAKSSTAGVIIGFILAIFVLFCAYAYVWYDLNVFTDLLNRIT